MKSVRLEGATRLLGTRTFLRCLLCAIPASLCRPAKYCQKRGGDAAACPERANQDRHSRNWEVCRPRAILPLLQMAEQIFAQTMHVCIVLCRHKKGRVSAGGTGWVGGREGGGSHPPDKPGPVTYHQRFNLNPPGEFVYKIRLHYRLGLQDTAQSPERQRLEISTGTRTIILGAGGDNGARLPDALSSKEGPPYQPRGWGNQFGLFGQAHPRLCPQGSCIPDIPESPPSLASAFRPLLGSSLSHTLACPAALSTPPHAAPPPWLLQ